MLQLKQLLAKRLFCAYQVLETSISHNELDGKRAWFHVAMLVVWICFLQFVWKESKLKIPVISVDTQVSPCVKL